MSPQLSVSTTKHSAFWNRLSSHSLSSRSLSYVTIASSILFLLALVFVPELLSSRSFADEPITVNPSITIGNSGLLSLSVNPGQFASTSQDVVVTTSNYTGYTMTIAPSSGSNTDLEHTAVSNVTIPTITPTAPATSITSSDFSNLNTAAYGLSIDDGTNYLPVVSGSTIKTTSTATDATTGSFSLTLGAKTLTDTPAGSYTKTFLLTATTNPASWSITYDKNADTDTVNLLPASNEATVSGTALTLSGKTPTRAAYKFLHWNTSADGTGDSYPVSGTINLNQETPNHITLYAIWGCGDGYICYNDNGADEVDGGKGTMKHTTLQSSAYSAGSSQTLIAPNYSKTGYGFASWNTEPDGSGINYGPNETVIMPEGSLQLYARWIASSGDLQNWHGCSEMNVGDIVARTDTRDNQTYTIAKLADGNCWMTENLRLDVSSATITSDNTNNPSANFITEATSLQSAYWDPCTDTTAACVDHISYTMENIKRSNPASHDSSSRFNSWYAYGGSYNWYTARAGNGTYSSSSTYGDLCPSGWTLPKGNSNTQIYALNVAINSGSTTSDTGFRAYPANFVYSGDIGGGDYYYERGSGGVIWSLSNANSYGAYALYYTNGEVDNGQNSGYYWYKYGGEAIRCINDLSYNIFITYNINGGDSGTMDTQTVSKIWPGSTYQLMASNFSRDNYGFAGWSENPNAQPNDGVSTIYGPNEVFTAQSRPESGSLSYTLYAVWVPIATDSGNNELTFQTNDLLNIVLSDGTKLVNKPNGYVTALRDVRDNDVYAIAKLADGNYWMIENLRLDPSNDDTTITAANTNNPTEEFINDDIPEAKTKETTWDSCTSYAADCLDKIVVYNGNTNRSNEANYYGGGPTDYQWYSFGTYYNWYTATAGNGKHNTKNINTPGDICPSGWHLPMGNTNGEFAVLNTALNGNSNNWRTYPNNFINSGYKYGANLSARGGTMFGWSATGANWVGGAFYSNYNPATSSWPQYYASTVRCIAGQIYTLSYSDTLNGPEDSSPVTPAPQISTTNTFTVASASTGTSGYIIKGWTTSPNSTTVEYVGGDTITVTSRHTVLYTVYGCADNSVCYTYDGNGADEGTKKTNQYTTLGGAITLQASDYSKNNYGFAGWSADPNAEPNNSSYTIYGPNETITAPSSRPTTNDGIIVLYAVWVPVAKDSSNNELTFQTPNLLSTTLYGGSSLNSKSIGYVTALRDSRDGQVYAIAKLADGKWWMIENLRLNPSDSGTTINGSNTNHPTDAFVDDISNNFKGNTSIVTWNTCKDNTANCMNQVSYDIINTNRNDTNSSRRFSYGSYYNWYTATAGNGNYDSSSRTTIGDICPLGWHLPTGFNSSNYNDEQTTLSKALNGTDGITGDVSSMNFRRYPTNLVYSGYYSGSSLNSRDYAGRYWSTSSYTSSVKYVYTIGISTNKNGINGPYKGTSYWTADGSPRYDGDSVRCIANGSERFYLSYSANGGSGAPSSMTGYSDRREYTFTISSTTPTHPNGLQFLGWSKSSQGAEADYQPGDTVTLYTTSPNLYLYAIWGPRVVIKFDGNGGTGTRSDQSVPSGSSITLGYFNSAFQKSGYSFAGWATTPNSTTVEYEDNGRYTAPSNLSSDITVTLYVVWGRSRTITYNINTTDVAAEGTMGTQYVVEHKPTALYASNFSRPGYGFAGWSENPSAQPNDGVSTIYGPSETIIIPSYGDGSSSMTLYAVWVPVEQGNNTALTFQSFNPNSSDYVNAPNGTIIALKDARDDDVYAVAKLADGNWWMIENLRIDTEATRGEINKTLSQGYGEGFVGLADAEVSYIPGSTANSLYSTEIEDGKIQITGNNLQYRFPRYSNDYTSNRASNATSSSSNIYSYGNRYTWAAAIASIDDHTTSGEAVAGTSICPSGWRLPSGFGSGEFGLLSNALGGYKDASNVAQTMNTSTIPTGNDMNKIFKSYPNNFYNGGYWSSNVSSIGSSEQSSHALNNGTTFYPGTTIYTRNSSLYIRCLVSPIPINHTLTVSLGTGVASVEIDGVTYSSNTSISLAENSTHTINMTFDSGYEFDSWSVSGTDTSVASASTQSTTLTMGTTSAILTANAKAIVAYMQNVALWESNVSEGEEITTIDSRDGNEYSVARLGGQLWMVENLQFTGTSLDTSSSNINANVSSIDWHSFASESGSGEACNASYSGGVYSGSGWSSWCKEEGLDDQGNPTVWYNYAAATAGTIASASDNGSEANSSLCPSGWRLPTVTESQALVSATNSDNTVFHPIYGGYYYNNSPILDSTTSRAYWWNSSASGGNRRNTLHYISSDLGAGSSGDRSGGNYIRCIRDQ